MVEGIRKRVTRDQPTTALLLLAESNHYPSSTNATKPPKFIVGSSNMTAFIPSAAPAQKYSNPFVSRLRPVITAELLKS